MWRIWKAGKSKSYLLFLVDNLSVLSAFVLRLCERIYPYINRSIAVTFQISIKSSELAQKVCRKGARDLLEYALSTIL